MMTGNEGRINNEKKEGKIRLIKNGKGRMKRSKEWQQNEWMYSRMEIMKELINEWWMDRN